MGNLIKKRKYILLSIVFMVVLSSFGSFAFAAVDSGYSYPTIISTAGYGTSSYMINSNINDYYNLQGNGHAVISFPVNSATFNAWFSSEGGTAIGKVTLYNSVSDATSGISPVYSSGTISISGTTPTKKTISIPVGAVAARIDSLSYQNQNYYNFRVNELEYSNPTIPHIDISSLTVTKGSSDTSSNLVWTPPSDLTYVTGFNIYRKGTLIFSPSKNATTYSDSDLVLGNTYTYRVSVIYSDNYETNGINTSYSTPNPPAGEVTNLTATSKKNEVDLSWTNPTDSLFGDQVNIYRDGTKIGQTAGTTFKDSSLDPGTSYVYTVSTISINRIESKGVTLTANTIMDEVINLKANPQSYEVDLSWTNPRDPIFSGVVIYRNGINIGHSNGTTFTDSNVKSSTTYLYTIKAISTEDLETDGVSVQTSTPAETIPVITGATVTKTDNGDYLYSWDNPSTGTLKILVGGQLYETVPASQKKVTIPAKDMKYDFMGNPQVSMIPISQTGLTGDVTYPDSSSVGTKIPFSVSDLISSGNSLLWVVAPFLLLALAFLFVPKLRRLLFSAFGKKNSGEVKTRRTEQEKSDPRESKTLRDRNSRHEGKEHLNKVGLLDKEKTEESYSHREPRELRDFSTNGKVKESKETILNIMSSPTRKSSDKPIQDSKDNRVSRAIKAHRERLRAPRERNRKSRESRDTTRKQRESRISRRNS